jgi:hypothetical protein
VEGPAARRIDVHHHIAPPAYSAALKAMMRKLKNELPAPRDLVPGLSERTDWAIMKTIMKQEEDLL